MQNEINLVILALLASTSPAATPAQQAYVKATHRCGNFEYFGDAIAVSGDTMVIGANFEAKGSGLWILGSEAKGSGSEAKGSGLWILDSAERGEFRCG